MKPHGVPSLASIQSAGAAYTALPAGAPKSRTATLKRRGFICAVATFVVIQMAGAIAALGMAFYVSSLASDIEDAIHKVNTVYEPLLTAVAQIDNMYMYGAKGAVWTLELVRTACGIPNFIPPELRGLLCGANGTAAFAF